MGDRGVGLDCSYVASVHWFYEELTGDETPEVMPGAMLKEDKG